MKKSGSQSSENGEIDSVSVGNDSYLDANDDTVNGFLVPCVSKSNQKI